jgi:hypothetical protein
MSSQMRTMHSMLPALLLTIGSAMGAHAQDRMPPIPTDLHRNKSVSDATYQRASRSSASRASSIPWESQGYYTLLAMMMNTARTPLPQGRTPALAPLPR